MSVTIRPAGMADQEPVIDLMEQLFEPPSSRPPDYDRERARFGFRWAVEREEADVLLAFVDGELAGLSSVYADVEYIRFGRRCWLQDLVVDRDHRSAGVGKALLAASADWARERGCLQLELASGASRVDAHRFYEREGMVKSAHYYLRLEPRDDPERRDRLNRELGAQYKSASREKETREVARDLQSLDETD